MILFILLALNARFGYLNVKWRKKNPKKEEKKNGEKDAYDPFFRMLIADDPGGPVQPFRH